MARGRVVLREHLGVIAQDVGELALERLCDARVDLLLRALEHRRVRRVADERVLEEVRRRLGPPLAVDELRGHQAIEVLLELVGFERGDRADQVEPELPADRRADLRGLLRAAQSIEAGRQRVEQRRRDGHVREGHGEVVTAVVLDERAHLDHREDQLLDEERDAVGPVGDGFEHLRRQGPPERDPRRQLFHVAAAEAPELELHHLRPRERRSELRARREDGEHPRGAHLADELGEQLQRAVVRPVQVLYEEDERLFLGHREEERQDRVARHLAEALRRDVERRPRFLARGERQRDERGEDRDRLVELELVAREEPLEPLHPLFGRRVLVGIERSLDEVDDTWGGAPCWRDRARAPALQPAMLLLGQRLPVELRARAGLLPIPASPVMSTA